MEILKIYLLDKLYNRFGLEIAKPHEIRGYIYSHLKISKQYASDILIELEREGILIKKEDNKYHLMENIKDYIDRIVREHHLINNKYKHKK